MIHVFYVRGLEKLFMGRLALKDRKILFEYDAQFIKTGLELSPFKLPLQSGVIVFEDRVFDGLFGLFNDSLPDGWGRLLLDRQLIKRSMNPGALSPLERLRYVGSLGMGALVYEPEVEGIEPIDHHDLDDISYEVFAFQDKDDDSFVDDLLAMNGSSAGARPKVLLNIEDEAWLIKFRSSIDLKDVGPIEYAYHLMAQAAGLDVPEALLWPSKICSGYFGVKRFDRIGGKRVHMQTMSGLLHLDHRLPSLDYETIMKVTLWLTKDVRECEKQFRAAVFNVLTHNRDDHAKNFSFLMDEQGIWHVSPSYDLTFSSGPNGEHCTMMMGEGKKPGLVHMMKLAEIGGLKKQKTVEIIEEVRAAVLKWPEFAKISGVSTLSLAMIQKSLRAV